MAKLHLEGFPDDMKALMQQWGQTQTPKWSLTRMVTLACQQWAERYIPKSEEDAARLAKIAELERQLLALKQQGA